MRNLGLLLAIGIMALLLSGCGSSAPGGNEGKSPAPASPSPSAVAAQPGETGNVDTANPSATSPSAEPSGTTGSGDVEQSLTKAALDIMDMLRSRDLERLAETIDTQTGLLFSPYAHIDSEKALKFTSDTLPSFQDTNKFVWGAYDGSGEPIELTFREYFEKFVYDRDFASAPDVSVGKLVGQGNVAFNGLDVFPGASYIEFHYPGFDKKNEGMDWESLILVMRPAGADWKLCAIAHSQWTV